MAAGRGEGEGPLIVLAGGGRFPRLVADAAAARGRPVTIAAIRGDADPEIEAHDHVWIAIGHVTRLIRLARDRGARDLVIVGPVGKRMPRFGEVDLADLWLLLRSLRILTGGEDGILRRIGRIFETRGLRLVGAAEAAPELLMPVGPLGRVAPDAAARAAIDTGVAAARRHGLGDVGQGVILEGDTVVLTEDWSGTDAMIAAYAARAEKHPPAVLVKCPKPIQDLRLDMPAIGPATVRAAAAAGLSGIAVVAGATLVADLAEVARAADESGIFVFGVEEVAA
jgi:DUF1009 family protein